MHKITVLATVCALGIAALAAPARAESINYAGRSSTGSVDISSQLTTDVTFDGNTVTFTFWNDVANGTASCVTDIYSNESLGDQLDFTGTDDDDIAESGDGVGRPLDVEIALGALRRSLTARARSVFSPPRVGSSSAPGGRTRTPSMWGSRPVALHKRALLGSVSALVFAVLSMFATPAQAETISFVRQSSNASQDVAGQLTVDLSFTTVGTGSSAVTTAHFRFLNAVGTAASITDIYFNDDFDAVFEFDDPEPVITGSSGVSFSASARPADPPGAFGAGWNTLSFSLDSDSPVTANGVNAANEWLQVDIELLAGVSQQDVIDVIDTTGVTGAVLAMHVQAIGAGGDSDWFYNEGMPTTPSSIVPEPASVALLGIGLGAALVLHRRRRVRVVAGR